MNAQVFVAAWAMIVAMWLLVVMTAEARQRLAGGPGAPGMMSSALGDGGEPPTLTWRQVRARERLLTAKVQAAIRATLLSVGVAEQDVDDLAQDTIVSALQNLHQYDFRRGRIEGWIWGIARNVAGHHRELARHHREVLSGAPDDEDPSPGAQELLEREADLSALREALEELPAVERGIVMGHDLDGRRLAELAPAHGVGVSTSYRLRGRALGMLAGLLSRLR